MLYPIENNGAVSNSFLNFWNQLMYDGAQLFGMNYIEFNLFIECVVKPGLIVVLLLVIYFNHRKITYGSYFRKIR